MSERDFGKYEEMLDEASRFVLPGMYFHYNKGPFYQFDKLEIDKETEGVRVGFHHIHHPNVILSTELELFREFIAGRNGTVRRYTWLPGLEVRLD